MSRFNACEYLLDRRVDAGDGNRLALTGPAGDYSYARLLDEVRRTAGVLTELGLSPDQRLLMFMADSPAFVTVFLAALRIGAVPVPVSTMVRADELADLSADSRARLLAVTPEHVAVAEQSLENAHDLQGVLVSGGAGLRAPVPVHDLDARRATAEPRDDVYATTEDSPGFWLYTSGTTGRSKGAMHRHASVRVVCETYATQVLGIRPDDRCLSAAKAFFAYGLGNSLLFPLSVGAAAVLEPAPSRPDVLVERVRAYGVTLFYAGPTFFANMLRAELPADAIKGVRLGVSAGETLPATLYNRWTQRFGVDILDGIGMTEMLHIFLSNREGDVHAGTTGMAVPGYDLEIRGEDGRPVAPGSPGTLYVRGASAATGYWSRYEASRQVFQGEWLRTGDTYVCDAAGYYTCLGRTSDMLKSSGMWVSPGEVEERLLAHPSISQAVVVAAPDADGLERPVAYVILTPGMSATEGELIDFCKAGLPSFKRPRKIVFVGNFPTTASGKVRRVELRAMAATVLIGQS